MKVDRYLSAQRESDKERERERERETETETGTGTETGHANAAFPPITQQLYRSNRYQLDFIIIGI